MAGKAGSTKKHRVAPKAPVIRKLRPGVRHRPAPKR